MSIFHFDTAMHELCSMLIVKKKLTSKVLDMNKTISWSPYQFAPEIIF